MLRLFSGQMIYGMRMIHGQGAGTVFFMYYVPFYLIIILSIYATSDQLAN